MSCIYEITCENCGRDLDYKIRLDSGDDLLIQVESCEGCLEEAKELGAKEAKEELE